MKGAIEPRPQERALWAGHKKKLGKSVSLHSGCPARRRGLSWKSQLPFLLLGKPLVFLHSWKFLCHLGLIGQATGRSSSSAAKLRVLWALTLLFPQPQSDHRALQMLPYWLQVTSPKVVRPLTQVRPMTVDARRWLWL